MLKKRAHGRPANTRPLLKKPAHGRPANTRPLLKKPAHLVPSDDSQEEIPRHLCRWRKILLPAFFEDDVCDSDKEGAVEMYTKCGPDGAVIYPIECYRTDQFDRIDDEIN